MTVLEAPADSRWQGYSLADRDRRWRAVRENAAREGFDAVFVPPGNWLDGRYLTQMMEAAVVLPTDGRVPIVINDRGWANEWIDEPRAANRWWGDPCHQAILDLGLDRARIGVVGLKGGLLTHVRDYEGVLFHGPYQEVVTRLPEARFEDATDVVGFARAVKSDEEIECLTHAAAIAVAGIEEMLELARPGVDEAVLYARVTGRLLELGSEKHPWGLITSPVDGLRLRFTDPPIGRRLQPGTLIRNEVDALWGGQNAQELQPVLLGPIPEAWKPCLDAHDELLAAGLEMMKPGATFGHLIDLANQFGKTRGVKSAIGLTGRGFGEDGPLLTGRSGGELVRDLPIQKGNTWVWKPQVSSEDGQALVVGGGTVAVTDQGGKFLVERSRRLVSIT